MQFDLIATDTDTRARVGRLHTDRGTIDTPVFMPVGTRGAVKALRSSDLRTLGPEIILGNTYHLYLRPGTDVLSNVGGLHRFMNRSRPILTDSGGYQVFSLKELTKIVEDGVEFRSHIDGSPHLFTPERVVEIQRSIGSDIAMVLDECPHSELDRSEHRVSMERSMRWAERAREHHLGLPKPYDHRQFQFGIVQGGTYDELRQQSAEKLIEISFDGYAIGGLAVGETRDQTYATTEFTAALLPNDQPRYLMGVGTPEDLIECVSRGVDMFDCVMPTRNARNGTIFSSIGKFNIRNGRFRDDKEPLDPACSCEACREYPRAYVRHLFNVDEITGLTLATIHNVHYYLSLMKEMRAAILEGSFSEWKMKTLESLWPGDPDAV